jgi:transcriptional regulator with XRE-family HTH domain
MERRKELATFLKTRRVQLSPIEAGLPTTTRRRTPGLRREEVAQLASVGLTWYTWLEQGRNISVSPQVLRGVSRALQLSEAEQRHLFELANLRMPEVLNPLVNSVDSRVVAIVKGFDGLAATLINQRWDVLAWNDTAQELCGNYEGNANANILYNMFVHPEARKRMVNWEEQAKSLLGLFRIEASKFIETDWYLKLIADLTVESPEFLEWWPQQKICKIMGTSKHYNHPKIGELFIETTLLEVQDCPNLKIIVNTPIDEESARKLKLLTQ